MKIRFISIKNFRGIKSLSKLEVNNLNTFVGKNDSGKSTILRALACFFDPKEFEQKDLFKGKKEDETCSIELSFTFDTVIDDLALDKDGFLTIKKEFYIDNGRCKAREYYLSFDFQDEKYQDMWNKKEQDLNQIISELGETPEKSGRSKTNLTRIEQIKKLLNNTVRVEIYHVLGDFLKNLEKTYNILVPEYLIFDAEQDLDIAATNFQSQFKPIINSYFESTKEKTNEIENGLKTELAKEFEEIRRFMTKNVAGLKSLNPTTEFDWSKSLKRFDLNLEFEDQAFDVPISHKGTGFKRLLMVAYFEYLASKKNIKNQIFAIEEPETYLHPSAQADLLRSILQLSEGSQFFLTTHSPIFAGATSGKNSILVTKDGNGVSNYDRDDENIINSIIQELGIKPDYNLLKDVKFLIFVEGIGDICFLESYSKTVLNKNLEEDKILCTIGGGSALINYAELDLFKKLRNGTNYYAVMVDGDHSEDGKIKPQSKIEAKCKADGALFFQLSKKDIENYCHPDAIRRVLISNIKKVEGEKTQNPKIVQIQQCNIILQDSTDVDKYLKELGICNKFKESKVNLEIFRNMSSTEWQEMDSRDELKNFIESIYRQIS